MLEDLIKARTNLVLQRSQAKDVVEQAEKQLSVVQGQIAVLEETARREEEANKTSKD